VGDDDRRELIDGTLYELPMTSFEHGHIASLIVMAVGPAYQLGKDGPGGWWIQGDPSVHDAIMRMEKAGLIARTPRQLRSIRILVPERDIPPFEEKAR
jgi:hypothetical protein